MLGYILTFIGGLIVGIIITTVLLCKQNLEAYTQISNGATSTFKQNLETAKAVYNAQINGEYDVTEETVDENDEESETIEESVENE